MLGWFRALMPREERFFELFARHAQVTLAGAEALRGLLNGGDDVLRRLLGPERHFRIVKRRR